MSAPWHRPVLRDAHAEHALTQQGYVVLPLLGAAAAAQLLAQLNRQVPEFPDGFFASVHVQDAGLRTAVNALLMATFQPLMAAACLDSTLLGGAFINKAPGPRGVLPPHQDWNIVDESLHRSFNVWVPLVDTDAANGAIQVLPGSHRWLPTVRGPGIPCVYRQVHARLRAAMRLLPISAGEVLIYDHRLLHCSDMNTTRQPRPGAVMGLVPAEAAMLYHCPGEGGVLRYRSSVDFLLSGQTHRPPSGLQPEAVLAHDAAALDEDQLSQLMSQAAGGAVATQSPLQNA